MFDFPVGLNNLKVFFFQQTRVSVTVNNEESPQTCCLNRFKPCPACCGSCENEFILKMKNMLVRSKLDLDPQEYSAKMQKF